MDSYFLQTCILKLSITNKEFLSVVSLLLPEYCFTSEVSADIYTVASGFFRQFNAAIGEEAIFIELDTYLEQKKKQDKAPHYGEYLNQILDLKEPSVDYIIHSLSEFIKKREFERGAIRFAELVSKEKYTQARTLMHEVLKAGVEKENVGLRYFDNFDNIPKRAEVDTYLMKTGVPDLDTILGGFNRRQFICIMGGPKGKKSWALIHFGITGLRQGLNVLHVTHELSDEETEARYDQGVGALTARASEETYVPVFGFNEVTKKYELDEPIRPNIKGLRRIQTVRSKLQRFGGNLIIKKFPMGSCSTADLDRYLSYLETYERFIPDVVINDYADVMAMDGTKETRHQINECYIWHKKLADSKRCIVFTASQVRREAIKKQRITGADFAEDIRKFANVDIALALCQTDIQKKYQEMLLYIIANRTGPQDRGCYIQTCFDIGQFCISSRPQSLQAVTDDDDE